MLKFNEKVWNLSKLVPKGKVFTYKLIVERLDCKVYRAVGNALNKSPGMFSVPCHRIVGSSGLLVRFANVLEANNKLLESEIIKIRLNNKIVDFNKLLFKF